MTASLKRNSAISHPMLKEFHSILIKENESVKSAMKQLDATAEKILFVVNNEAKLIGSLSDGDIRRWILSSGNLEETVGEACFKKTYYVEQNYDLDDVKKEMLKRKINFVPVIDDKMRIVGFLKWDRIFGEKIIRKPKIKLDTPVVIMAGGIGTRLDPFTKILPKALIPIGEKSIIEIIIEKFLDYGVDHFYISVNYKSKILKSYFDELDPPYSITFINEQEPLGTAGSLKSLQDHVSGSFLVTNCDIIIDTNYNELVEYHHQKENDITLVASLKHYKIPYGLCEIGPDGILLRLNEKPEYNFFVNAGMYVIKADVLKYIPEKGLFHITQLMERVKSNGGRVRVFPISENSWIDTGEWTEYKKAVDKLLI